MAITDPAAMTSTELLDAYTDPWFITSQKQAMRDELLRRLSAGNPQAGKVQIVRDMTCPWWVGQGPCGKPSRPSGELCQDHYTLITPTFTKPERSDGHRELPPPDYDVDRLPRGV